MKLTQNQVDVLSALKYCRDHAELYCKAVYVDGQLFANWGSAPIDFGGQNGTHHSGTATALAKKGLVDREKNGKLNIFTSRNKGSCYYRITDAGIDALAAHCSTTTDTEGAG